MRRLDAAARAAAIGPLAASLLLACGVEQGQPTVGCASISDCGLDWVCDVLQGVCLEEYDPQGAWLLGDRVLGRFSCQVVETGSEDTDGAGAGVSEVIAGLGEDAGYLQGRWTFPTVDRCSVDDAGQFDVRMRAWGTKKALSVTADVDSALAGGASLGKVARPFEDDSLVLWDFDTGLALAYSTSGVLLLDGRVSVGATVEGYLDVMLRPVLDVNDLYDLDDHMALGTPCPDGVGDCGSKMGPSCVSFGSSPICSFDSFDCTGIEDCLQGGAQCLASDAGAFCLRVCQSDDDCVPPPCQAQDGASVCL